MSEQHLEDETRTPAAHVDARDAGRSPAPGPADGAASAGRIARPSTGNRPTTGADA
ncbi:hypothetical protein [Streptomyces sp. MCC20]|uniref:hypothetical protein n=1 Tax=Streptomyces sediminimaris TaxID=3383721 RepID=UPI00399B44FA